MTTEQKIQYIADHYGYEPQSRQLIEEMPELPVPGTTRTGQRLRLH